MKSRRIVLFANTDWYLFNFRIGLARRLAAEGHKLTLIAPEGPYTARLKKEFEVHIVDLGGGSMSLSKNLAAIGRIRKLYKRLQPDLVHHFTIKCVLFGGLNSRCLKVPTVNAVTGLGHIFTSDSWTNRAIRSLVKPAYRFALGKSRVIFQNDENRQFFLNNRLVEKAATHLIRGSGADCDRFLPRDGPRKSGPCRFLFASRLIREKGVFELLEATRLLRSQGLEFELQIAGDIYPGNPSSISIADLELLKHEATYLGHVDDLLPHMQACDALVLPSYAEGTPRVLLEGGACGKPLIATDIAGCRGVVQPGVNGTLVPAKEVQSLAEAMREMIENPEMRETYGKASREIIMERFSETHVIDETLQVYEQLLGQTV